MSSHTATNLPTVEIYTDGSCLGNPGPGGWAAILSFRQNGDVTTREICGFSSDHTTNNRMELEAAIQSLSALTRPCRVALWTDSEYLKKGMTEWVKKWIKNNWRTAGRKPVENSDLWKKLIALDEKHLVEWRWVKAHDGHHWNERVDRLAYQQAILSQSQPV